MDAGLLYKANITFKDNNPMKWVEEAVYLGANITRDINPRLEKSGKESSAPFWKLFSFVRAGQVWGGQRYKCFWPRSFD